MTDRHGSPELHKYNGCDQHEWSSTSIAAAAAAAALKWRRRVEVAAATRSSGRRTKLAKTHVLVVGKYRSSSV